MVARQSDADSTSSPEVGDVEDLLTVMEESDWLWIYRRSGDRFAYLERRPKEAFVSLGVAEATRQRTGGGQYRAAIRKPNGHFMQARRFAVAGAELPVPADGSPTTAGAGTVAAAVAASGLGDLPPWVKQLVLPILTTVGAGIAAKLFEKPQTDPLILELIRRSGKSDSIDPIELQRLMLDSERRGEDRGRQLGELSVKAQRVPVVREASGVVDAIREAVPLVNKMIDASANRRRRALLPSSTAADDAADHTADATDMPAAAARPTDIVPAWLRPYVPFKSLLIDAADNGTDAPAIAEIVLKRADDATFGAMIEAEQAGRLETDLYAAMPELQATPRRKAFVVELLEDIRRDLIANMGDEDEDGANDGGVPAPAVHAATPAPVHAEPPAKKAKAKKAARA